MTSTGWLTPPQSTALANAETHPMAVNSETSDDPIPKASSRLRLSTVADVKRQMRLIFIEARNGELATAEASRYIWMLDRLANLIADKELEERISQLESEHD